MTEITLNPQTLPSNTNRVKFELLEEPCKWLEGQYIKEEQMFLLDNGDFHFAYINVSRWHYVEELAVAICP